MFKRAIIRSLEKWKADEEHKPLILRGARQVGKTTVVNDFGRQFDNYLYFNMEVPANLKLFETDVPLPDLVPLLFAAQGKVQKRGTTLVFIDEIQNSPKTMALLRYFYEQLPKLYVIAAGSLLENLVDIHASFPVGRVQYLALRPCSFFEFLGALERKNLLDIMAQKPEYTVPFHAELMSLFQRYVVVGGMPEVVNRYAAKGDLLALDGLYETLVQSYKDDVEKYVKGGKAVEEVRFILSYGWAYAGQAITLGNFAHSSYKAREVGEAFRLLEKAMLTELAYPTSSPVLPILPEMGRAPKLLWLDTGLVNYQAGIRRDILGADDILDVWKGHIAEQVVAQELLTLTDKTGQHRTFWARENNRAEVDFVHRVGSTLLPIEVKNGHNARLRSLHEFMKRSTAEVAVRVWSGPYSIDTVSIPGDRTFRLINLPFYLLGHLETIVEGV